MPAPALPTLALAKSVPADADVIIVGLAEVNDIPTIIGVEGELAKTYARSAGSLESLAASLGATPKVGTATLLPGADGGRRTVVVGLGGVDVTPEQLRRAVGAGVRLMAGLKEEGLHVADTVDAVEPHRAKTAAERALLGASTYAKVPKEPARSAVSTISLVSPSTRGDAQRAVELATATAKAVCVARDWVNTPANLLYPESFADEAKALFRDVKVGLDVLDERALEKDGYGGILAVGGGSARKPRLVRVEYAPRGARSKLVLVGKGITFDTGGLNLKPADGMYTMKCDMGGAAAVLAATHAVAALGLKVGVVAYAAMAENMPSATAYHPSDVLTMYGGTTVENANSDAEGRLVMADALARSQADKADLVVDVATLTGACMVALGLRTAGLFASDDETADLVLDAAEAAGENFWQLPIPAETRAGLDSLVADLRSSGAWRMGGGWAAACFLQQFVAEDAPWAHLDIAGPAFNAEKPYDYVPAGGTGFAVRTLVALASALQS